MLIFLNLWNYESQQQRDNFSAVFSLIIIQSACRHFLSGNYKSNLLKQSQLMLLLAACHTDEAYCFIVCANPKLAIKPLNVDFSHLMEL